MPTRSPKAGQSPSQSRTERQVLRSASPRRSLLGVIKQHKGRGTRYEITVIALLMAILFLVGSAPSFAVEPAPDCCHGGGGDGLSVVDHVIARDVVGGSPVPVGGVSRFFVTDTQVVSWVLLDGDLEGHAVRWMFIPPHGQNIFIDSDTSDHTMAAAIPLQGLVEPGFWTVNFFIVEEDGGASFEFADTFEVLPDPAQHPSPPPTDPSPQPPSPPQTEPSSKLTKEQKDELKKIASNLGDAGIALGITGTVGCGVLGILGGPVLGLACGTMFAAGGATVALQARDFNEIADDPPDSNFKVIAQPITPSLPSITAQDGVPQELADAHNALMSNRLQIIGLSTALLTSIERAQGAANAGDASWETRQTEMAAQYASDVANLLSAQPALLANVEGAWESAGLPDLQFTTDDVRDFQAEVNANGLPASFQAVLSQLGADATDVEMIRADLLSKDPSEVASLGSFPGFMATPALITTLQGTAQAMNQFASSVNAFPSPSNGSSSTLASYDSNGNNRLDTDEFLTLIDAWINGEVDDSAFFEAIDLWISQLPIAAASVANNAASAESMALSVQVAKYDIGFAALGQRITELDVEVYDLTGNSVFRRTGSGAHISWNLQSPDGRRIANGVYLANVTVRTVDGARWRETRKLLVLR